MLLESIIPFCCFDSVGWLTSVSFFCNSKCSYLETFWGRPCVTWNNVGKMGHFYKFCHWLLFTIDFWSLYIVREFLYIYFNSLLFTVAWKSCAIVCVCQCCDGTCPSCTMICGKMLGCRQHKCPSICHRGLQTPAICAESAVKDHR